ncbi:hypothetical protein PQQ51_15330 [Paraburkholderia xenovorans]|uniref:hypothetical protein n=1 Tax=Paraburkholderia xenovorans TaxID=36873 RepID=UPI0038BBFD82
MQESIDPTVRRHGHFLRGVMSAAVLLCASGAVLLPVQASAQSDAVKALAAPPPIQLPLKPSPEFAKFPRYAGMLGSRQIVLRLGAKTDDPAGVHGEYQYTDTGEVILIAGDRDGDTLEVEESNDGTHITGNWVGKFAANGSVSGERMNVDDSDPREFDLKPLAAGQAVPPAAAAGGVGGVGGSNGANVPQPSASGAAAPAVASAVSTGHAVGGVSNLQTGE